MLHQPVLLNPVIEQLHVQPAGVYIDATFGRGGHTQALLAHLSARGRVYAIDRDPEAVAWAREEISDARFTIEHGAFDMLMQFCQQWSVIGNVNGILLDLGVSSPQLDNAARGFSFSKEGDLDMRMDNSQGISAREWLAQASEKQIADVLWRYGEERFAKRIARKLIEARSVQPITTTGQLARLVSEALPMKERHKHPATRTFQAIRIFVNRELEMLEAVLQQALEVLSLGGRLLVISFHSLEDRIVKRMFRREQRGAIWPRDLPVTGLPPAGRLRVIGKPVRADAQECEHNPRARSAILRVAEKIA